MEYVTEEFRFAEKWGKMLSQTMVWGKRGRVERGSAAIGGMDRYGYIKVRHADKSLVYEKDEEEAPIIQKISSMHVTERLSLRELARRLKGTPTPKETRGRVKPEKMSSAKKKGYGEWNYATIYAILRDPTYYQGYIEYYVTSDQYEPVQVPIPPLITKEAFEESQRLLNNGRRLSVRNTKNEHLCARLLYCSCGATMQVKYKTSRKDAYICGRTKYKGDYNHVSCDAPIKSVVTELVDTKVWEWIIEITEHPHTIRKYLETAKETLEHHNAPIIARIAQIEESRRRLDRKVDGVLEMAVAQKDEARAQENKKAVDEVNAMLQRFRAQLEQDLAELREEEDTLRSQLLSEVINDTFIGQWDKYASKIGDKIAEFDFKKRRDTLESLHFKGTLGVDNGERVVWVYLFDSFTDTVYLDRDVGGDSVDNLPSLVTGDEPGRNYLN